MLAKLLVLLLLMKMLISEDQCCFYCLYNSKVGPKEGFCVLAIVLLSVGVNDGRWSDNSSLWTMGKHHWPLPISFAGGVRVYLGWYVLDGWISQSGWMWQSSFYLGSNLSTLIVLSSLPTPLAPNRSSGDGLSRFLFPESVMLGITGVFLCRYLGRGTEMGVSLLLAYFLWRPTQCSKCMWWGKGRGKQVFYRLLAHFILFYLGTHVLFCWSACDNQFKVMPAWWSVLR